jgi:hypothetical protein
MRTAVLIGKKKDGTFITLAHPDTSIGIQKLFLKQLRQENGRSVLVGNERVDLDEAILFESGSGKRVKFKEAGVSSKKAAKADLAGNLDQLAEALGVSREELDVFRKLEGFPVKEKQGYNIEVVKAFIAALPQ